VQLSLVVIYYWLYAEARDWHGSIADDPDSFLTARDDGFAVLDIERWLHIDVELGWQHALLQMRWLVKGLDAFYGSAHFLVTALVLAYLLLRGRPAVYRYWRNVLALATGVALACFALFPTLPPRLLPSPYGYVDTLHVVGGLWSYNSGVLEHISDPYAALPSLHIVWAGWCALVLWRLLRRHWTRWIAVGYPFLTAFAVIVTGNHWILDLVAGASVLLGGWALTGPSSTGRIEYRRLPLGLLPRRCPTDGFSGAGLERSDISVGLLDAREHPIESTAGDGRPAVPTFAHLVQLQRRPAVRANAVLQASTGGLHAPTALEGPELAEAAGGLGSEDDLACALVDLIVGAGGCHPDGDVVEGLAVSHLDRNQLLQLQTVQLVDLVKLDQLLHLARPA